MPNCPYRFGAFCRLGKPDNQFCNGRRFFFVREINNKYIVQFQVRGLSEDRCIRSRQFYRKETKTIAFLLVTMALTWMPYLTISVYIILYGDESVIFDFILFTSGIEMSLYITLAGLVQSIFWHSG